MLCCITCDSSGNSFTLDNDGEQKNPTTSKFHIAVTVQVAVIGEIVTKTVYSSR